MSGEFTWIHCVCVWWWKGGMSFSYIRQKSKFYRVCYERMACDVNFRTSVVAYFPI